MHDRPRPQLDAAVKLPCWRTGDCVEQIAPRPRSCLLFHSSARMCRGMNEFAHGSCSSSNSMLAAPTPTDNTMIDHDCRDGKRHMTTEHRRAPEGCRRLAGK